MFLSSVSFPIDLVGKFYVVIYYYSGFFVSFDIWMAENVLKIFDNKIL